MKNKKTSNLMRFIKRITKKLSSSSVDVFAAQSAFFIIISFFPFAILLLTIIKYIPAAASGIENFSVNFLSDSVSGFVNGLFSEIYEESSGAVISFSTVMALWSSSRGLLALINGLNGVYDIKKSEVGGFMRMRAVSVIYTLALAGVIILTMLLLVFGDMLSQKINDFFPGFIGAAQVWLQIRWGVQFLLLTTFFVFVYTVVPERKTKIINEIPGALISAFGWAGFSWLYSFYITKIATGKVYGSLTAVVFLMLWLYFCMYILFFGAVINDELTNINTKKSSTQGVEGNTKKAIITKFQKFR